MRTCLLRCVVTFSAGCDDPRVWCLVSSGVACGSPLPLREEINHLCYSTCSFRTECIAPTPLATVRREARGTNHNRSPGPGRRRAVCVSVLFETLLSPPTYISYPLYQRRDRAGRGYGCKESVSERCRRSEIALCESIALERGTAHVRPMYFTSLFYHIHKYKCVKLTQRSS